jgi:iron complex outermembrane recepter protein
MPGAIAMVHSLRSVVLVCALLLSAPIALARQEPPSRQPEQSKKEQAQPPGYTEVVTVTGSKTEEPQRDTTQRVGVISSDEIAARSTSSRNITELIQYQPGVSVTVLSRSDANWGSYGGLGPKYTTYLLDGLPIDSFVDTMSLDPWAFARVETHQGPASVLYSNYFSADFAGTQAPLAGITNLVLKERIAAPVTHIVLDGGSWNTLGARLYHEDHAGNLHYFVGTTYEQSDYTDYGAPNSWLGMLDDPAYKKMKVYGRATYFAGSRQKLSVFAQHTLHNGFTGRINRDYDHNYDTVNVGYANDVTETLGLQVKTGLRKYDRRWGDDNYPAGLALVDHSGVQQTIVPIDALVTVKHRGNSSLAIGADGQFATYTTYTEPNAARTTDNESSTASTGVYLQEKYVSGRWVLRAGGRVNRVTDTYTRIGSSAPGLADHAWTKVLWSTGARVTITDKVAAFANAGSSFVSPAAKAVGGTLKAADAGIVGRNGQLPNPNLKPESGVGSDFGIDLAPAPGMTLGLRGFYNRVTDAIVDNVVSGTPSQTQSVNAGNARSYGFELVYDQRVVSRLHAFANVTRTASRIENPIDQDQNGSDLSFVPGYVFNAGVAWDATDRLRLSPYLHAVGTYYDSTSLEGRSAFGPYQVVNLKVEQTVSSRAGRAVVLFADLNNLTNQRYVMPWQFRDPGFNMIAGLDLHF